MTRLNAPFGARCFLTYKITVYHIVGPIYCLNAPFGARCFLTERRNYARQLQLSRLNAPFGARCFLTEHKGAVTGLAQTVLMHLLALGAF